MKVFAIGDLHLPGNDDKPMNVFGPKWDGHFERICDAWASSVSENDVVLIPGDISWAMHLEDAVDDINAVSKLSGRKIIMRGNHDYWWNSLSKIRELLPNGMFALQNDSVEIDGVSFCGSRGWICEGNAAFKQESDGKLYVREVARLEMSLKKAKDGQPIVGMMHFPPFNEKHQPTGFTELFERFGVKHAVYAHLHGKSCKGAFEGERNGVTYTLCSADHLNFTPKFITEF
ncbi:MAG: metallophosphoesterase [Clostridia bacterium]|nr:metallophosphoesterase [Clostridia bacterium]